MSTLSPVECQKCGTTMPIDAWERDEQNESGYDVYVLQCVCGEWYRWSSEMPEIVTRLTERQ